jgi:pimeloyl-ACP methyl ester carboxylesterase
VIGPLEDRVVPAGVTRSVAARIRDARYVAVPAASHSVAAERPDLIAELIADFVAR